jgi:hypothetical protein
MIRTRTFRVLLVMLLVFVAADSQARLASRRALRSSSDSILIIGNSFTSGIKNRLRHLAHSAGRDVYVGVSAGEGYTLAAHAASPRTLAKLHSNDWRTVVLQEQSDGMSADRYDGARQLDRQIDAINGNTVFFMTWRDRGADLADYDALRGEPGGDTGYVPIAFELGAAVAPIGWAFREILLADPDADLWSHDGHHASERGRYIAALVLFATIYGESPVGLWTSPSLPEDQAFADQLLVEQVVLANPAQWNITLP